MTEFETAKLELLEELLLGLAREVIKLSRESGLGGVVSISQLIDDYESALNYRKMLNGWGDDE